MIRLPVRAEHVTLTREVVSYERVVIRRARVDDDTHVEVVVQREQLRFDTLGQAKISGLTDTEGREADPGEHDSVTHNSSQIAARHGLPWRSDASAPSLER